jgi:hypothetical protein
MGISLLPSMAITMATILAWPQILDTQLAQQLGKFAGLDLDTCLEMPMHDTIVSREGYSYTLGGPADGFSITPEPGQLEKFDSMSLPAHEPSEHEFHGSEEPSKSAPLPECEAELPGHMYLVDGKDHHSDGGCVWECSVMSVVVVVKEEGKAEGEWQRIRLRFDAPVVISGVSLE